ncbi:uncharacterized protein LOC130556653 isoform X3 [Triplophysa rosa]|uniref:uncharacterized protein LOC130556653 isoform X3 n=1 Tax=Triplophysa rosa TaxID=992332 RepID=UPI002545ECA8|nr:uncharacterized protein LOC130556653 isoform X3 [Triplophysa rosa]
MCLHGRRVLRRDRWTNLSPGHLQQLLQLQSQLPHKEKRLEDNRWQQSPPLHQILHLRFNVLPGEFLCLRVNALSGKLFLLSRRVVCRDKGTNLSPRHLQQLLLFQEQLHHKVRRVLDKRSPQKLLHLSRRALQKNRINQIQPKWSPGHHQQRLLLQNHVKGKNHLYVMTSDQNHQCSFIFKLMSVACFLVSSPERQESVGQETATKPAVAPAAPPQQESSTQRQRDESESQAPPAVAAAPSFPTTRASTEAPVTAASPPQLESSTETLDMKVQTKSESQEPPAAAAVPETAPGDVVDTSKISNKAKRRMRKMRNILKRQETAEQETQMQEVSETLETDTSIEHLCELLDGLHLSSEPSAPATQSPVLELHHIGANSSGTFNRLKPLCPATFIFKFSPTFDFGPTQETDSQMSGQEVSTETPETEEPRETPSPSEGQGAALEPVDHVGDVSSASPRASKAVKKTKRRMTKTKKTDLQQRQEVTDPRETDNVEHLCELLDGYIFLQSPLPQPHHLPFLSFIE